MSKINSGNVMKKNLKILSQSESTSDLTNKLCLSQEKRKIIPTYNISSEKILILQKILKFLDYHRTFAFVVALNNFS